MRMKIVWSLLVSAVLLCCATNLAAKSVDADSGYYTTKDKEFYLTPEQLLFIRPGLEIEILNVEVPADLQLEVTYSIKDPAGLGLDHDGIYTPGATDMRFTLANIPMGDEQKVRLTYEDIDADSSRRPTGTLTSIGDGVYKYKFDAVIDSDQNTTHTIVLGGRRDLREFELDRYADNAIQNWVPTGLFDAVPRDIVTTDTCNRCHDPLQLHGRWQQPQACTQCHNPPGNTRFEELIHAVHAAGEAGGHDFSEVVYPAPLNACETCHTGGTPTENFPLVANPNPVPVCDMSGLGVSLLEWGDLDAFEIHMDTADGPLFAATKGAGSTLTGKWVQDGTTFVLVDTASGDTLQTLYVNTTVFGCVSNAPGTFRGEAGAQHTNWLDHPSRVVCGACHSNINWQTGEGHDGGPQEDDSSCANCHRPDTGNEFDRSVKGAHTELYKSSQLPGVIVEFLEVTNSGPGEYPTVLFSVGSKSGPLDPANMNRLRFKLSGPNEDFSFYESEDVENHVQVGDNWAYTFETAIPADAEGSYTVSVEARNIVEVDMGDEVSEERDTAENPQLAFAVTDDDATWRRTVVDDYNCEDCHSNLSFHGGNRHDPDYCGVCHMPEALDRRDEETIAMKYMIHSIHRGAELENGFAIGSHDYSEVEYPGDLRNCDSCHTNNSQQIPLADGVLPTITPQAWWSPMMPQAAACLSCHDGDDAAVHAYTNTAFFGESCSTCHGEGKAAAVDKVHAQ